MIEFEDYKVKIHGLKPTLDTLRGALKLEDAKKEADELEAQSAQDGFWNDIENSQKVLQRIKHLKHKCEKYDKLASQYEDLLTLCQMAIEENDDSLLPELEEEFAVFEKSLEAVSYTHLDVYKRQVPGDILPQGVPRSSLPQYPHRAAVTFKICHLCAPWQLNGPGKLFVTVHPGRLPGGSQIPPKLHLSRRPHVSEAGQTHSSLRHRFAVFQKNKHKACRKYQSRYNRHYSRRFAALFPFCRRGTFFSRTLFRIHIQIPFKKGAAAAMPACRASI